MNGKGKADRVRVQVYLTGKDFGCLKRLSRVQYLTASQYCRYLILKGIENAPDATGIKEVGKTNIAVYRKVGERPSRKNGRIGAGKSILDTTRRGGKNQHSKVRKSAFEPSEKRGKGK